VTSGTIGTEADTVVGLTQICLVLGVSVDVSHFMTAMGELAFVPILAGAMLREGSAHLCLVSAGCLRLSSWRTFGSGGGLASSQGGSRPRSS